jgi:hypothetical protein
MISAKMANIQRENIRKMQAGIFTCCSLACKKVSISKGVPYDDKGF